MSSFERETVRRKPIGTLKLMVAIGLIAFSTNLIVQILSILPAGTNRVISIVIIIFGFGFVWQLISHNVESFTYKITEDQGLLVIERQMGRSSTSFLSLKLNDILEMRAYDPDVDRKIPRKRRFTVSRVKSSWRIVIFEGSENKRDKLLFEPSEAFIESLSAYIAREKVKS